MMIKNIFLFGLVLIFFACQKEVFEKREYPRIKTLNVVNVSSSGALLRGEVLTLGNQPINEYGFFWDTIASISPYHAEEIIVASSISKGSFSASIDANLLIGKKYFVKAFVKTDDFYVKGDTISFMSMGSIPAQIESFYPRVGNWGDTINITGKRFSTKRNDIFFGNITAKVIHNSDTLLKVIVPDKVNPHEVDLLLKTEDNITIAQQKFSYLQPVLKEVKPLLGNFNDTIKIKGSHFSNTPKYLAIQLGGRDVEPVYVSDSLLKIVVPADLKQTENKLMVSSEGIALVADQPFKLNQISLVETVTDTITNLQDEIFITIKGKAFNPVKEFNRVTINNYQVELLEASTTMLKVRFPIEQIPLDLNYTFINNFRVEVEVADQIVHSYDIFVLKNKGRWTWFRRPSFPGPSRSYAVSFELNGKLYVGAGTDEKTFYSDFYEYTPETRKWRRIADMPGGGRAYASSLVIEGVAYVGFGTSTFNYPIQLKKDWYRYEASSNQWIRLDDFPGDPRYNAYSFVISGRGYIGGGYTPTNYNDGYSQMNGEMWEYNHVNDHWSQLENGPEIYGSAYVIGDAGYVYQDNGVYKYSINGWERFELPWYEYNYAICAVNDKPYMVLPSNHNAYGSGEIYSFNIDSGTREDINFPGKMRSNAMAIGKGNSLFVGMGQTFNSSAWEAVYLNDFYELVIDE